MTAACSPSNLFPAFEYDFQPGTRTNGAAIDAGVPTSSRFTNRPVTVTAQIASTEVAASEIEKRIRASSKVQFGMSVETIHLKGTADCSLSWMRREVTRRLHDIRSRLRDIVAAHTACIHASNSVVGVRTLTSTQRASRMIIRIAGDLTRVHRGDRDCGSALRERVPAREKDCQRQYAGAQSKGHDRLG